MYVIEVVLCFEVKMEWSLKTPELDIYCQPLNWTRKQTGLTPEQKLC